MHRDRSNWWNSNEKTRHHCQVAKGLFGVVFAWLQSLVHTSQIRLLLRSFVVGSGPHAGYRRKSPWPGCHRGCPRVCSSARQLVSHSMLPSSLLSSLLPPCLSSSLLLGTANCFPAFCAFAGKVLVPGGTVLLSGLLQIFVGKARTMLLNKCRNQAQKKSSMIFHLSVEKEQCALAMCF